MVIYPFSMTHDHVLSFTVMLLSLLGYLGAGLPVHRHRRPGEVAQHARGEGSGPCACIIICHHHHWLFGGHGWSCGGQGKVVLLTFSGSMLVEEVEGEARGCEEHHEHQHNQSYVLPAFVHFNVKIEVGSRSRGWVL